MWVLFLDQSTLLICSLTSSNQKKLVASYTVEPQLWLQISGRTNIILKIAALVVHLYAFVIISHLNFKWSVFNILLDKRYV